MKRNRWIRARLWALALAALWLSGSLCAQAATPGPTVTPGPTRAVADAEIDVPEASAWFYVLDEADALSEQTERDLFFLSQTACEKYGFQLVVVTVESTEGVDIGDYAYTLYNRWGIGTMRHGSGLLLLMAVGDGDYCAVEGPNHELDYRFRNAFTTLDEFFEAGDYDAFADRFATHYLDEMVKLCDIGPKYADYNRYTDYYAALNEARQAVRDEAEQAREAWVAAGASWEALRAEGGGGVAYREVAERWAMREAAARAEEAREAREEQHRQEDGAQQDKRVALLIIVGVLLVALFVYDSRHGWDISLFLLRCVLDALVSGALNDNYDSGGHSSGGNHSSGGGGHSSGGGAGRGR